MAPIIARAGEASGVPQDYAIIAMQSGEHFLDAFEIDQVGAADADESIRRELSSDFLRSAVRSAGRAHTLCAQLSGPSADRWLFVAAPTNALASLSAQVDFRFANDSGSFAHNLRTIVVDPKRHIYRQFEGNKWKAEGLAEAIAEVAIDKTAPPR